MSSSIKLCSSLQRFKMAKRHKKKEPEIFFVGVEDPIELRRSILESSKEIVQYLQRFERFKKVRSEKASEIVKLRIQTKEINKLVRQLKLLLPKTKLRRKVPKPEEPKEIKRTPIMEEEIEPVKIPIPKIEAKPMSDIEKLEAELSEIEDRLGKLS